MSNTAEDSIRSGLAAALIDPADTDSDLTRLRRATRRRSRRRRATIALGCSMMVLVLGLTALWRPGSLQDPSEVQTAEAPSPSATILQTDAISPKPKDPAPFINALGVAAPSSVDIRVPQSHDELVRYSDYVAKGTIVSITVAGPYGLEIIADQESLPNGNGLVQIGLNISLDVEWSECSCEFTSVFVPMWSGQSTQIPENPEWGSSDALADALGLQLVVAGSTSSIPGLMTASLGWIFVESSSATVSADGSVEWAAGWEFSAFADALRSSFVSKPAL